MSQFYCYSFAHKCIYLTMILFKLFQGDGFWYPESVNTHEMSFQERKIADWSVPTEANPQLERWVQVFSAILLTDLVLVLLSTTEPSASLITQGYHIGTPYFVKPPICYIRMLLLCCAYTGYIHSIHFNKNPSGSCLVIVKNLLTLYNHLLTLSSSPLQARNILLLLHLLRWT